MFSVGETLRRARQQQGLDLGAVAARTKISGKYLEAIESDNRKLLPSGFFYKSFVDQYARSLHIDTQEIDAEVDRLLMGDAPLPLPGFENVVARNVPPMRTHRLGLRIPRWFASAASFLLVVCGCSAVYVCWHEARTGFSLERMMDNVRAFAEKAPAKPSVGAVRAKPAPKTREIPRAQPAPVAVALASEIKPISGENAAAAPDHRVMLDLLAHEATWLSVSSDGKPVFSGTLHPNETKTVSGKQFAKVRVGNAAGLEVRLNGKPLGPLGARGQVLTVLFTPDNFQIFSAPRESD
jgi:cytoskeleton protein RodZ